MRKNRSIILIIAVFCLLFLATQWFFIPKTFVNSRIITALQAPVVLARWITNQSSIVAQLQDLARENQSLRAQLSEARLQPTRVTVERSSYMRARVYSTYPFNNADKVVLNAGSRHGVRPGMLVVVGPGIFFGEIISVTSQTSEVRTLFSKEMKIEVKIGPEYISSLLEGGNEPTLTLISKKKPASTGQEVILASKKYTYGLHAGVVGTISESNDTLFEEAVLRVPYTLSEINEVFIVL